MADKPLENPYTKPKEKKGRFESLARGALQGATMGYSDEIAGALGAGKDLVVGDINVKDLPQSYRESRDDSRQQNQQAQQDNPNMYTAGDVVGSGASLLAPGMGALKGIKGAAAIGGLMGLGKSEADLTQGEIGEAAKDTAIGGAIGGAAGGVVSGAKALSPRFAQLAEKLGIKKAPLSDEEAFRKALNPDVFNLQKTGKPNLQNRLDLGKLEGDLAIAEEMNTADFMNKVQQSGLTPEEYARNEQLKLLESLRNKSMSSDVTQKLAVE